MESCIICEQDLTTANRGDDTSASFPQEDKVLAKQLRAVFVLRELLRLPPGKLADFLALSGGDHPDTWISLCSDCEALAGKALYLYQEKQRIHRKIKEVGKELVSKLKKGNRDPGTQKDEGGESAVRLQIVEETRSFVRHYEYGGLESPFLVGDWEAQWRVTAALEVKQEVEETEGSNVEKEEEAFSAASPESFPESSDSETHERPTFSRKRPQRRVHYTCPVKDCRKTLSTSLQGITRHKKLHRRPPPRPAAEPLPSKFPCPLESCSSVLSSRKGLGKHVQFRHGMDSRTLLGRKPKGSLKRLTSDPAKCQKLIPCPVSGCPTRVVTSRSLGRHLKNVHKIDTPPTVERERQPRKCTRTPIVGKETPRVCHIKDCCHECLSQSELYQHRRTQHGALFPFQCSEEGCTYCTAIKGDLYMHTKNKHGKRLTSGPFVCEICQQEFPKLTGLLCHRRQTHSKRPSLPVGAFETAPRKKKPGKLEQCPQCGVMVAFLANHVRYKHEGHRKNPPRFHCEHCGHATITNCRLIQHQAKEHHICGVVKCQRCLGSREELHRHQVDVHGGQFDVFQCTQPDCKMLFITKSHLRRHVQHHEIKNSGATHVCEMCGKSFLTANYLHYHKRYTHQKCKKKNHKEKQDDPKPLHQT